MHRPHDPSPDAAAARLREAFDIFELGIAMLRARYRRDDPRRSDADIDQLLDRWLATRPGAENGDAEVRIVQAPQVPG